jgi:hypothetical protein
MPNRKGREMRKCVERCLDDAGVLSYVFVFTGSGHQKVSFEHNGKKCSYVFPSTASDRRAEANTRSGVRRMLAATRASVPGAPARGPVLDARGLLPRQPHAVGNR